VRIAVTACSPKMDSEVDPRLGRAATFVVYDTDTDSWEGVDNVQNAEAVQGAGIQAAQNLIRCRATAVLTGHCGPKAYRLLSAAHIDLYTGITGTVQEAVQACLAGMLKAAQAPDVEGHW